MSCCSERTATPLTRWVREADVHANERSAGPSDICGRTAPASGLRLLDADVALLGDIHVREFELRLGHLRQIP